MDETIDTIRKAWNSGTQLEGVNFALNESVALIGGKHSGQLASVISLEAVSPEPRYLIELGLTGGSLVVEQSQLRRSL
jgi:hypothetical protein